jgi:hypothetical protein
MIFFPIVFMANEVTVLGYRRIVAEIVPVISRSAASSLQHRPVHTDIPNSDIKSHPNTRPLG